MDTMAEAVGTTTGLADPKVEGAAAELEARAARIEDEAHDRMEQARETAVRMARRNAELVARIDAEEDRSDQVAALLVVEEETRRVWDELGAELKRLAAIIDATPTGHTAKARKEYEATLKLYRVAGTKWNVAQEEWREAAGAQGQRPVVKAKAAVARHLAAQENAGLVVVKARDLLEACQGELERIALEVGPPDALDDAIRVKQAELNALVARKAKLTLAAEAASTADQAHRQAVRVQEELAAVSLDCDRRIIAENASTVAALRDELGSNDPSVFQAEAAAACNREVQRAAVLRREAMGLRLRSSSVFSSAGT